MQVDALIVGAGAAGLFCAIEAGKRGRSVAVLEHSDRPGKKILISGGGRCNFTNLHCRPENFLSANPHFVKSALARYTQHHFLELVQSHGIAWHEKKLGQLFCDSSSSQITGLLDRECANAGVQMFLNQKIRHISRPDDFWVETNQGSFRSETLVIATGGPSIPKMGATGFGYRLAEQFGLALEQPRPALVPLVFAEEDRQKFSDLSGLSVEVKATCQGTGFHENLLITHRGVSGPAILQISSYWHRTIPLAIEWQGYVPKRLAARLGDTAVPWNLTPAGTEGFEKAEVSAGGVSTAELSSKTMESKNVPGLFFVGEVVDVTGHLGGFNFQWAWSSGFCAGQYC